LASLSLHASLRVSAQRQFASVVDVVVPLRRRDGGRVLAESAVPCRGADGRVRMETAFSVAADDVVVAGPASDRLEALLGAER
jgi:pilus assembly protein CpaF